MRRWLAALAMMLAPLPVLAHPHVLIDSHMVVIFEAGRITGLQMGWKFDPVYSSSLVQDYDKDKSGSLSAKEIADMEREAFQDTQPYSYFTYAKVDDKPVQWPRAEGFTVMVVQDSLLYGFRLRLPEPVDPRKQTFSLSTYEETYYIDIDFANETAVRLIGDGSDGCRAIMSPDSDNKLYGGIVVPNKVEITCAP
ncbi:DUF1007 family protein [Magnetospirillum aberrantis]|uniref:DUF1007 family protein n=1 Tax=Magnetospirillum aberrantis SpK TaxID=908842 RepID=A0A7C9UTP1_9PROT|nr:DUF1007 family protein [Magnetospirillum aberrantis]NFV80207.1 DUF1007 family protein [Magnetospirillum aberrantis SpK]